MKFASPDIQFELEGHAKSYTLRFGVVALAVLQDHWGLANLDEVMVKVATMDGSGLGKQDYDAIMWAGLRSHHPDMGESEAAAILDYLGLPNLTILLTRSMGAAFPQEGGGKASGNPPSKRPGR